MKVGEGLTVGSETGWVSDQRHGCVDEDGLEAKTHREKDGDKVRRKQAKWTYNEAWGAGEGLGGGDNEKTSVISIKPRV